MNASAVYPPSGKKREGEIGMDGSQKCPCFNDDGGLHASSSCECLLLLRTRFLQGGEGGGRKEGGRKRKLLGIRSAIATASDFRAPLRKGGRKRVRNEAGGRGWALPAWPSSPDVPAVRDFFFEAANHPQSSHLRFLARILRRVQVIVVALLETVPF